MGYALEISALAYLGSKDDTIKDNFYEFFTGWKYMCEQTGVQLEKFFKF